MNTTIIIQRNYKPLIDFSIFISIFLSVRFYFINHIVELNNKIDLLYINSNNANADFSKPLYSDIESFEIQFGGLIVLFGLIIFYNLSKYFNQLKHQFVLLIIEIIFVWIIFSCTTTEMKLNAVENDRYYISLLIFIPYLYFIYHNSIIGKKVDVSGKIKIKKEIILNEKINDLNKLSELNLISQEDYDQKKEILIKDKIREDIKETEEYSLLLKSKQKGLLNEDEFNTKVENLINIKFIKNNNQS